MKLRKHYLPVAAVLGAAVAVLPALAGATAPSEVKLEVNQNCVDPEWPCWTTEGSALRPQPALKVTIAVGGDVVFTDHDPSRTASVVWTGGPTTPSCPGVPTTTTASTGWEGTCSFTTQGTYHFESSTLFKEAGLYGTNDYTKYEIVVEGSTTTTGTTGTTGTTTTSTTTSTSPASPESPLAGSESQAVRVAKSQRGGSVKGSLQISKDAVGDRLEVDLLATTASLAKAGHATQVVGRLVSASVSIGQRSFSVKLNAKARRALKRHHHLALKVKITLTPVNGEATSVTRSVTLHV